MKKRNVIQYQRAVITSINTNLELFATDYTISQVLLEAPPTIKRRSHYSDFG